MTISSLLLIVVETLVSQFGTQYLGAIFRAVLDFLPGHTVIAAAGGVSDVPATALSAPKELVDYTTSLLQKVANNANLPLYAKIVLNQVIKFLPELEDSLWNMLFTKGLVPTTAPSKPLAAVGSFKPVCDELLEHCKL